MKLAVKAFFKRLDAELVSLPWAERIDIMDLLSAQRGPDTAGWAEKHHTVARIRARTLPQASLSVGREVNYDGLPVESTECILGHFGTHMRTAKVALERSEEDTP